MEYEIVQRDLELQAGAISYWAQPDIKSKIKEFLSLETEISNTDDEFWYPFIKKVVKMVDPSSELYLKQIAAIKSVGKRIFAWYKKIRGFYNKITDAEHISLEEIYDLYLDEIHWKSDFNIDEVRIIKSAWGRNPKISMVNKFEQACHYCLVEDIRQFPLDVMEGYDLMESNSTHIIAFWEHWRRNDLESFYAKIKKQIYVSYPITEYMLRLSCRLGYTYAVKYFFRDIKDKGADNIISFLKDVVWCYPRPRRVPSYHEQVDSLTNILFFLSYLSEYCVKEAIINAVKVLDLCKISDLCIFYWHLYKNYLPIVQSVIDELNLYDYHALLQHMLWGFRWEWFYYGTHLTHSFHYELFHKIWSVSPQWLKKGLVALTSISWISSNILIQFLGELCEVHDYSNVQLIINDPDLTQYKKKDLLEPDFSQFREDVFSRKVFEELKGWDRYTKFEEMFITKPRNCVPLAISMPVIRYSDPEAEKRRNVKCLCKILNEIINLKV